MLKAIAKYESHRSIFRITNYMKEKDLNFSFEFVHKPKISKKIKKLDSEKACQEQDIPVKLIKLNKDLFSHFIYRNFNNSLFRYNFPSNLKAADTLPTYSQILTTIVQLVFFLRSQRFMKDVCMTKCINTSTKAVFAKVLIFNIVY